MTEPTLRKVKVAPTSADDRLSAMMEPMPDKISTSEEDRITVRDAVVVYKPPSDAIPEDNNSEEGLIVPRTIGLVGAVSFIVGTVIGSGIFISPKGVAENSGSVAFTLCSWSICGIISMLAGLCYAELGCVIRESGADYAYLDAAFGSPISFIFCWCWAILLKPATIATLALAFSQYIMTSMFEDGCGPAPELIRKVLAIAVLLTVLGINVYSSVLTTKIQIFFTAAKLIALIIIIVGGIVMLCYGHTKYLKEGFNNTQSNPGKIAVGFYSGMFAYDAWNAANFIAEEIINPGRNLPLAIIIAIPLCIFIYVFTIVSYFSVMSVADMVDSEAVAITWAKRVIPAASWLIPVFVALSAFGSANGTLFVNSRLLYVTGRNGQMPKVLGMVNVESYTLSPAAVTLAILAFIFTLVGEIGVLINFVSFLQWMFYGANMLSVIIFRYKAKYKDLPRPFKVPLVIPAFVFLCAIFIVVVPIVADPKWEFLYAGVFIVIGYMLYVPFVFFNLKLPCMDKFTTFLQLYLRVAKTKVSTE